MTDWNIVQADVMDWCRDYDGPKFHAMLTDCPWELKFMGRKWDASGISFQPETWAALSEHLLPGAFIMVFAASRGWHRLACAIEDAGFVIQPSIFVEGVGVVDVTPALLWVNAQSFPKASRLDKKLDERANAKQKVVGRRKRNGGPTKIVPERGWHSDPNGFEQDDGWVTETEPATDLAKAWAGHRYGGQILRDCATPVVVAQKPWTTPRLDCIVETGAGALWVDGGRIVGSSGDGHWVETRQRQYANKESGLYQTGKDSGNVNPRSGRWPPNYCPTHFAMTLENGTVWGCVPITEPIPCPDCSGDDGNGRACEACGGDGWVEIEAVERVKGQPSDGSGKEPAHRSSTENWRFNNHSRTGYADKDGTEPVRRFACARHCSCGVWWRSEKATRCPECGGEGEWACAVRLLDADAGPRQAGAKPAKRNKPKKVICYGEYGDDLTGARTEYKGSKASRFYPNPHYWAETAEVLALGQVRKYQAKPSRAEREAGLDDLPIGTKCILSSGITSAVNSDPRGMSGGGNRRAKNTHPCIKSLSLNIWLSRLLLPPDIYAPRRLLCPFAGTGSEAIGALLAGWEHVTMVEQSEEYCQIAEARTRFWHGWSERTGKTEPKAILKAYRKAQKKPKVPRMEKPQQAMMELRE